MSFRLGKLPHQTSSLGQNKLTGVQRPPVLNWMSSHLLPWVLSREKASGKKIFFNQLVQHTSFRTITYELRLFLSWGTAQKLPSSSVIIPIAMLPKWVFHWAELIAAFHLYFLGRGFVADCPADTVLLKTLGPKKQHAKVMGGANPQARFLWPCHAASDTQKPSGLAEEKTHPCFSPSAKWEGNLRGGELHSSES